MLRHPLSIKDLLNKRLCSSFKSLGWLHDEIISRRNVTTVTTVTNVIGGLWLDDERFQELVEFFTRNTQEAL